MLWPSGSTPLMCAVIIAAWSASPGQQSQEGPRNPLPVIVDMQRPVYLSATPTLAKDTPVMLRLTETVKPKTARVGDKVSFVLFHDLFYRNLIIAKAGTPVESKIVDARKAKWASRGSKLAVELSSLKLLNGQTLPLRGSLESRGGAGDFPQSGGAPFLLVWTLLPGRTKDWLPGTGALALVESDFKLDFSTLPATPPKPGSERSRVLIVRGYFELQENRNLYCNGIPIAHLNPGYKIQLNLMPGYYRFAISPGKAAFQLYVISGTETTLIATSDSIREFYGEEESLNTTKPSMSPWRKPESALHLLWFSKFVDNSEIYSTACTPLMEEVKANPQDQGRVTER